MCISAPGDIAADLDAFVQRLGPSLPAQRVVQVVMNPKLEIHVGAALTSQNSDWQSDDRVGVMTAFFASLAPNDEREAALFLALFPGAYTVFASSEDGAEGIVLTEVYDAEASL